MEAFEKLINVCNAFKHGDFNIEEFQSRIETIYLPSECKNTLEKAQHNACNKLEEILFSYTDTESQKTYADKVADELVQATSLELKGLNNN